MKHVYESEVDWYVAESEEHARELCIKSTGCTGCGRPNNNCMVDEDNIFIQCPDDFVLHIRGEDGRDAWAKPCREWAEQEPCGFLCSTEY